MKLVSSRVAGKSTKTLITSAFFGLLLSLYVSLPGAAEILEGRIINCHDGDSVTLLMAGNQQVKIRLFQVDAPEINGQAFGQQSQQSLSDMVINKKGLFNQKNVRVEKETIDKYGRTVGTIFVDGLDANREQVKRGMAWAFRQYLHDQSLLQVENEARRAKIGLWSDPNPMPPWEYRHSGNNAGVTNQSTAKIEPTSTPVNSSCGSKRYCKEMASCEEAKFHLTQCGLSHLDKDGDGIPCEKLCGHDK